MIDTAIEAGKQVQYDYNKYGIDKNLHKSSFQRVTPYQLILHNQKYYLLAKSDGCDSISYFRLDRITKIKVDKEALYHLTQVKMYERGINYNQLATQPYLDGSNDERVEMIVDPSILDEIIDTYGKEVQISDTGSGKYTVFLKSSAASMEHYAMQYVDSIEIVKPQELRERIKESLKNGLRRYDK
jgi:predicted DNA-binding transcriptional regulator YafY